MLGKTFGNCSLMKDGRVSIEYRPGRLVIMNNASAIKFSDKIDSGRSLKGIYETDAGIEFALDHNGYVVITPIRSRVT